MVLSMTGYGKAGDTYEGKTYNIDIRTLNGKAPDLRLKSPTTLRSKEIELRKIIMNSVVRGKVDCNISVSGGESDIDHKLNLPLIQSYIQQLKSVSEVNELGSQDLIQTIIRIPNVVQPNDEEVSSEEWAFINQVLAKAIEKLEEFRREEGQSLSNDLSGRVEQIQLHLQKVSGLEEQRKKELVDKIRKSIAEHIPAENADPNRLEQEIVYYLERLDIHEEKVRLAQHCSYFTESLESDDKSKGKKLNFIAQEMGREINTLGSKAQYSPLQQIVVEMKVELDQIKEQLANVL